VFRCHRSEFQGERDDQQDIDASHPYEFNLLLATGNKLDSSWSEYSQRMRLKGNRKARTIASAGPPGHFCKQHLMSKMYTIKIAYGDAGLGKLLVYVLYLSINLHILIESIPFFILGARMS